MSDRPKLSPGTIARLQGILDGTIKIDPMPVKPFDPAELKPETRARLAAQLSGMFDDLRAEAAIKTATQPPVPLIGFDEEANMQDEPDAQELSGADEIIAKLIEAGHGDYTAFRREIALDIYANGHYAGNDTAYFNPDEYDVTSTLPGFYVIQEDHYDQHMDDDEDKPSWDSMVGMVQNGYLWTN